MARLLRLLPALLLLVLIQIGAAAAEKRVALVIGNGGYANPAMRLDNPARDARLISAALQKLGFDVETVADAGKEAMEEAVVRLASRSGDADLVLFYYAGHAMQDLGKNYLMPVDASLKVEQDLRRRFVRLDDVLSDLANLKAARIIILDACRDNDAVQQLRAALPQSRSAGMTRGLAAVPKISGMLVAFATQPDRVAADGTGANGPFAQALAARLVEPGVELRTVLTRVRLDVARATQNAQVPEVSDSLLGELYLQPAEPVAPTPQAGASDGQTRSVDLAADTAFWSSVERIGTKEAYEDYRARFGRGGFYSSLAERRIAEFDKAPPAVPPVREAVLVPPLVSPAAPPIAPPVVREAALAPPPESFTRPRVAADAEADVAECDRLGASPLDPQKPAAVAGVAFDKLDAAAVVDACAGAVARFPAVARLAFQLGRGFDAKKDYPKAHGWYERAAELGSGAAMHSLGLMHHDGSGVERDYAAARRWFEKAVDLGSPAAMNALGHFYHEGLGVGRDFAEARRWYERGAALGSARATNNLGTLYAEGRGLPKNLDRACELFRRAASLGDEMGQANTKNFCTGRRKG